MSIDLTFKQVCEFIRKDEPTLIESVDKILGLAIVCSPVVLGPGALPLLSLLSAKNELTKIGRGIFEKLVGKKDSDFLAHHERMEHAYGLICFTSFFEAVDRALPSSLRKRLELLPEDKRCISDKAIRMLEAKASAARVRPGVAGMTNVPTVSVPFPHPVENLGDQRERLSQLYGQMVGRLGELLEKLAVWEDLSDAEKAPLQEALRKMPEIALNCFDAQYFELANAYSDFGVWANLQRHDETKKLLKRLSRSAQQVIEQRQRISSAIDVGFAGLHEAVLSVPRAIDAAHAADVVEGLRRYYEARIGDPIIEDKLDEPGQGPRLAFPRIRDAFVPQSYRVIRQTTKTRRLESEDTWKEAAIQHDLGPFLLSYLSSPYSLETPLVVLGHPGSGKSLLTRVLSATLLSEQFTPLRVPLRELGELPIPDQIEHCVAEATGERIDSWARLSSQLKNSPPVIILDGYDELLQISGKVYQSYLKEVRNFQKAEAERGRPVRVIVTSRLTLIDKATMPEGATIVRLAEFNKDQRNKWISVWNQTNDHYFSTTGIEPFELPGEKDPEGRNVLALAEQPLLLLMLALYDSEDNGLRKSKGIDRTLLYDSLLRRFVRRELLKDKRFDEKDAKEQAVEIDRDMKRLAVAALGMYNRRQLHTLSSELNSDVSFFNLERKKQIESGKPLSQADMLLGSFFFVHKSKALQKGEAITPEESSAFEFLHNTFGEFLTADFIVRQALAETQSLADLERSESLRADLQSKLERPDGFSKEWFTCLIYTPLFSRPVVLEMLREWVEHSLRRQARDKKEFLDRLDEIILNQIRRILCRQEMPAIMQGTVKTPLGTESTPFAKHPLLGHMSIYSVNLITLRTILSPDGYRFAEDGIETHEDGSRPWDQLTYIWRSWFALDNLNGLTAILAAERNGSVVTITPRDAFRISTSSSRLETVFNVSSALADNTTSGLAGILEYNASRPDQKRLEAIQKSVETEGIDLKLQLALKRLVSRHDASERSTFSYGDDPRSEEMMDEIVTRAIESGRGEELHTVLGILWPLREGMARRPIFERGLHPEMLHALLLRVPRVGISFLRLLVEGGLWFGEGRWPRHFQDELFDRLLDPRLLSEVMERSPEVGGDVIELVTRIGGHRSARRFAEFWLQHFDAAYLRDLAMRRPESFVAMLALFEGPSPAPDVERIFAEVMEGVEARDLLQAIHRRPAEGIRLIRVLRKTRDNRLGRLTHEVLEHLLDPEYLRELIMRRPGVAAELLQLFRKALPGSQTAPVLKGLFRDFEPRQLGQVLHWDPITGGRVLSALIQPQAPPEEWLARFMDPRSMAELLWRREDATAELLGLIVEFEPSQWSRECFDRIAGPEPSGALRRLLRKIPVGAAHRLKSLAESKNSLELASGLRAVLAGSE